MADIMHLITRERLRRTALTVAALPGYGLGYLVGSIVRAAAFLYASCKAGFMDGAGITEGEDATT